MDQIKARAVLLSNLFVIAIYLSASAQPATQVESGSDLDWDAITGTWILQSAERNGQDVDSIKGTRYFLEPGLMRWANPELKSDATGMAIMMGRLLKHVEGNKFRTEAIYPIAENGDVEINVDGEFMVMVVKAGVALPILTITLQRKHGRSPKPPQDKMIGLAKQSLQEGKLNAANQFAQLQLINYPDDREAAIVLADSQLVAMTRNSAGLTAALIKRIRAQSDWVLEKYPDAHGIRRKYGALLNRVGLYVDAATQFETLEQAGQYHEDSMRLHAQSLAQMGRREQGRRKLEEMIGYDTEEKKFTGRERISGPNSAFLLLAAALAAEGKQGEAVAVIDHFVETYPTLPKAYLDRGRFFLRQDVNRAKPDFDKALELGPTDLETLLVNIEVRLRDPSPQTDELIERTFENHGRGPVLLFLAATRAGMKAELDKALALADEGLALAPNQRPLLLLKAQLLIQKQDRAAAETLIKEMPKRGIRLPMAQLLRVEMLIGFNEFSDATRVLADIKTDRMPPAFGPRVEQTRKKLAAAMEAAASTSISDSIFGSDGTNPPAVDPEAPNAASGSAASGPANPSDASTDDDVPN